MKNKIEEKFDADDRGNVVDFYETANSEKVARLDREAEIDGHQDQLTFENWSGGTELEAWMRGHGYEEELNRAVRI